MIAQLKFRQAPISIIRPQEFNILFMYLFFFSAQGIQFHGAEIFIYLLFQGFIYSVWASFQSKQRCQTSTALAYWHCVSSLTSN